MDAPTVSVVIATYNRPDVLRFAIRSVLAQDIDDWELLVIGDACSEATAAAVASFGDPRIRYVNLALNYGDQSGPNNVGISRARGRYIAFLNHDDLWFPDHLNTAIGWLAASGADAVAALTAEVVPDGTDAANRRWTVRLQGRGRRGRYDPVTTWAPASSMVLKSEVARAGGPWPPAADCLSSSSQEWLFGIWRRGYRIRTVPHLSVVRFSSGDRPGAYVKSGTAEHSYFEDLLKVPGELRLLLLDRHPPPRPRSLLRRIGRPILHGLLRCGAHLGLMPDRVLARLVEGLRRGQPIATLRKIRGLPPLSAREPSVADLRARYQRPGPHEHDSARPDQSDRDGP